jgi:hypothetical protein
MIYKQQGVEEVREELRGERGLVAGIIIRAWRDVCGANVCGGGGGDFGSNWMANDAYVWLFEAQDEEPFSFKWCCAVLDLDWEHFRIVLYRRYVVREEIEAEDFLLARLVN